MTLARFGVIKSASLLEGLRICKVPRRLPSREVFSPKCSAYTLRLSFQSLKGVLICTSRCQRLDFVIPKDFESHSLGQLDHGQAGADGVMHSVVGLIFLIVHRQYSSNCAVCGLFTIKSRCYSMQSMTETI